MTGTIYYVRYVSYSSPQEAPFFSYLASSLDKEIPAKGYKYKSIKILEDADFDNNLEKIKYSDCAGILLLGTDISSDQAEKFSGIRFSSCPYGHLVQHCTGQLCKGE